MLTGRSPVEGVTDPDQFSEIVSHHIIHDLCKKMHTSGKKKKKTKTIINTSIYVHNIIIVWK